MVSGWTMDVLQRRHGIRFSHLPARISGWAGGATYVWARRGRKLCGIAGRPFAGGVGWQQRGVGDGAYRRRRQADRAGGFFARSYVRSGWKKSGLYLDGGIGKRRRSAAGERR